MSADPVRRRRWQFSLRALLVFVAICALVAGWFRYKLDQAQRQSTAVKQLRAVGGQAISVVYGNEEPGWVWTPPNKSLVLSRPTPREPGWLEKLLGQDFISNVAEVDISVGVFGPGKAADVEIQPENWEPLVHLQRLSISGLHNTESVLAAIPNPDGLRKLMVDCYSIDPTLPWLVRFKNLRSLALHGATDGGLAHIDELRDLANLDLAASEVGDATMDRIVRLPKLKALNLSQTKITDRSISKISALGELEELHLAGAQITDAGFAQLGGLANLRTLELGGEKTGDASLAQLSQYKQLNSLTVYSLHVTDVGLAYISQIKSLENLTIHSDNFTDAGVDSLEKLRGLKSLDFYSPGVTQERVKRLQTALPKTTISFGFPA